VGRRKAVGRTKGRQVRRGSVAEKGQQGVRRLAGGRGGGGRKAVGRWKTVGMSRWV
jgi:hypothetical protein